MKLKDLKKNNIENVVKFEDGLHGDVIMHDLKNNMSFVLFDEEDMDGNECIGTRIYYKDLYDEFHSRSC